MKNLKKVGEERRRENKRQKGKKMKKMIKDEEETKLK